MGRTLIPGAALAAYTMTGVQGGAGGRIPYGALPGAAWCGMGGPRANSAPPPTPGGEAQTYQVSFLAALTRLRCPVEGCQGGATSRTNLWVHFAHRHVRDTIVILEEGKRPYPRCLKCDMFVSQRALNGRHPSIDLCQQEEERKHF